MECLIRKQKVMDSHQRLMICFMLITLLFIYYMAILKSNPLKLSLSLLVNYDLIVFCLFVCLFVFLQEMIATCVLFPTVSMVCDPDYINQTIAWLVSGDHL